MKQLFLNYKTFYLVRFWIIFSAERCEDTKIKAEVGMQLYQEQACTSILLYIVKMILYMWACSELLILCLCRQMLWICLSFQCQLWLWSSLLKNVRRYSWALIDSCGTKLKHEPIAHPSTNSAKYNQVFYSAGSGEDLSTMLKGNPKTCT